MKHAYLILAHDQPELLEKLIGQLDRENNDIYIHVDRKSDSIDPEKLRAAAKKSRLTAVRRIRVWWGDASVMRAEMILLRAALKDHHDYYHLLSGSDLVLRSAEEIDRFFETHAGSEFISFDTEAMRTGSFREHLAFFYLPDRGGRWTGMRKKALRIQKKLGVDRNRLHRFVPAKGSQWFDVTEDFARFLCSAMRRPGFACAFRMTHCVDEIFVHTVAMNSPFAGRISDREVRYIDWEAHGRSPKTLTMADHASMMASSCLYARKFDAALDGAVIETVLAASSGAHAADQREDDHK